MINVFCLHLKYVEMLWFKKEYKTYVVFCVFDVRKIILNKHLDFYRMSIENWQLEIVYLNA